MADRIAADQPKQTGAFSFLNPADIANQQRTAAGRSFGEALNGQAQILQSIKANLAEAKNAIKAGDLTFNEFLEGVEPLLQLTNAGLSSLASGDPGRASGLKTELSLFFNVDAQGRLLTDPRLPFTQRELTNLPENVLPTLEDIDIGRIPVDILPPGTRERVQRIEETRIAEAPPEDLIPQPQVTGPDGQPLLPGQQQLQTVPDPQNPGQFIQIPVVGDITNLVPPQTPDQAVIEAEARRQEEQQRRAFEASRGLREQGLEQTAQLLARQRGQAFEQFVPQAAEQLQTRGLLQTSELENVLGREQSRLQQESETILGGARIASTQQEIADINRILAQRQGLQQAGIERRFSIEDFERQQRLAKELGAQITPEVGGGQGSRLTGALQGGVAGASAGAVGGIPGTAIGGLIGAGLGAAGGGK